MKEHSEKGVTWADLAVAPPTPADDLEQAWLEEAYKVFRLFRSKQADYGPSNIAAFGEFGVLVRANDKLERLKHLYKTGDTAQNEPYEDSWHDLAGYAIIALLVRHGRWPGGAP